MPDEVLVTIQYDLLYSNKKVKLPTGEDRHNERTNDANAANRTLDYRIDKFHDLLEDSYSIESH